MQAKANRHEEPRPEISFSFKEFLTSSKGAFLVHKNRGSLGAREVVLISNFLFIFAWFCVCVLTKVVSIQTSFFTSSSRARMCRCLLRRFILLTCDACLQCFDWCWKDFAHVQHNDALFVACCHYGSVGGPIYVKNGLSAFFYWRLKFSIFLFGVEEAPYQLLVFEGPNEYFWILPSNCQQGVVGTQWKTTNMNVMSEGHQTFCFVPSNVIQTNCLIHAQCHNESNTSLRLIGLPCINVAPLEITDRSLMVT